MTDAEIIARGHAAAAALGSLSFQRAVNDLLDVFQRSTFATAPAETAQREQFYQQHLALQSVLALMATWQVQGEQLVADAEDTGAGDDSEEIVIL